MSDTAAELEPEKPRRTVSPGVAESPVTTEDVLSREEQKVAPLFAGHVKVYPKAVTGRIRRNKTLALIALLAIYYVTPWIRWDRGPDAPDQAILIDMGARRAYFFWIEIWPQEVYYLAGLLILGALGLFLATSLFGRIWCGFTCPQTVWTDLYMWVERWIEGDRTRRMRLDQAPMSAGKVRKKALKHAAWLGIALLTGGAWVMYFQDAPTFVAEFFTGQSGLKTYFFVGLFTGTTYLLAGFAREQVCTYMCPWPRFQAALLDKESLVVTYHKWRGEPRGKHKKGQSWENRGDCIDCKQCVAVCPTGIDIRDGLQLECIGCGLCIDACDGVMDKVERPRGLIAFATEANEERRLAGRPAAPLHLFRPRTFVYLAMIALVGFIMLFALASRSSFDLNVIHDRNPLFVKLSDGSIRNGYQLKILNKAREEANYRISVEGLPGAKLQVLGLQLPPDATSAEVSASPDGVATYQVFLAAEPEELTSDATQIEFVVEQTASGQRVETAEIFRGPPR